MPIVRNKVFPFKGFSAVNVFGIIFVRSEAYPLSATDLHHEQIHTRQMQELAFVPFYMLYLVEWIFRSIRHRSFIQGYYNISFEREAYGNQNNIHYLQHRPHWGFLKYW